MEGERRKMQHGISIRSTLQGKQRYPGLNTTHAAQAVSGEAAMEENTVKRSPLAVLLLL